MADTVLVKLKILSKDDDYQITFAINCVYNTFYPNNRKGQKYKV